MPRKPTPKSGPATFRIWATKIPVTEISPRHTKILADHKAFDWMPDEVLVQLEGDEGPTGILLLTGWAMTPDAADELWQEGRLTDKLGMVGGQWAELNGRCWRLEIRGIDVAKPTPVVNHLAGLTVPAGYQLVMYPAQPTWAVVTRPDLRAATVDFDARGVRAGMTSQGKLVAKNFTGKGWRQALVTAAVAWLGALPR